MNDTTEDIIRTVCARNGVRSDISFAIARQAAQEVIEQDWTQEDQQALKRWIKEGDLCLGLDGGKKVARKALLHILAQEQRIRKMNRILEDWRTFIRGAGSNIDQFLRSYSDD